MPTFNAMLMLSVIAALLGACTTCIYFRARHSPLNAAPAVHWSCVYTGLWLWWQRRNDSDTLAVHEAHMRYGPVVRLAPRELSVCDVVGGLKPIYEGRLPKTDWYQVTVNYGAEPSFAMMNEESHRRRKRLIAKPYLNSSIKADQTLQTELARLADELRASLQMLASQHQEVEMFNVFFAWALASVSTYVFGSGAAIDLLGDLSEARQLRDVHAKERSTGLLGC